MSLDLRHRAAGEEQASGRDLPPISDVPPGQRGLPLDHLAERAGWSGVCMVLLTLAVVGTAPVDIAIVAVALWGGYRCWSSADGPSRGLQVLILATIVASIGVSVAAQGSGLPYGTDELAFGQYAATLVLRAVNPFTHSLAPSLSLYHVPASFLTHYLNGSTITTSTYPAGSFLLYLPALALGLGTQASIATDVVSWIVSMILIWALLPRSISWLAALFLASSVYISYAIGGVTDSLYLPFVILALWRWDRFGESTERSVARWIGPIALGVAMSVKQTPWFLLPFLLVGVAFEARAQGRSWLRSSARYLAICAGVFVVINAPWIIASPGAWFDGSILPLLGSFTPMGQGLVNLTLIGRIGGGDLTFYTLAGVAWLVLALLGMGLRYAKVKRAWVFVVITAFFFVPRSMSNYLLMLIPAAIVAALSVRGVPHDGPLVEIPLVRRCSRGVLAISVFAVVAAVTGAVAAPAPLDMAVTGVSTNGQQGLVTAATLQIHNNTARVLHPTFTVVNAGYVTNFWTPARAGAGPVTVGPHQSEVLTLQAPDESSMPDAQAPFRMFAYTTGPAAVSSTQAYMASARSTYLMPDAVEAPIPLGKATTFTVQVDQGKGSAGGVRVDLGQVIYAQSGSLAGVASIDGLPEGASPASAITDAAGVATFTVTGVRSDTDPDYLQAWIAPPGNRLPPTGYSEIVAVRFTP
jgi:hypothetical protein